MKFDKRTNWKSLNSEELEREYNPSSVIGGDYLPYVQEYIKQSQFSKKNLNSINCQYGPKPGNTLDLFIPKSASPKAPCPLMIFIHGGYWQELTKNESEFSALDFNEKYINYLINNNDLGKLFLFNISECVKFVYLEVSLPLCFSKDNPRNLHLDSVKVKQISPRPFDAIKFISAALTNCDAITRSPSFSLFSSSIMMTISPFFMDDSISSVELIIFITKFFNIFS